MRIFLAIILGLLMGTMPVSAQEKGGQPYAVGEKITYAIKKLGMKAGKATLVFQGKKRVAGQDAYLIVFTATALNFFDEEKIYVDTTTFRPLRVERDLNIWGKKEKITEDYDPSTGRVRIRKTAGGKVTEQEIAKGKGLDNIYGFIYRYRRDGNFQIGDALKLNLPTQDVAIALVEKDDVKAAGKVYNAYFMESEPKKYRLWFDSSSRKIPLRIDGAVGFGNTSMVMSQYQL